MQNTPVGIVLTRDQRIVCYNPRFAEIYGFEGDAGVGSPVSGLYCSSEEYDAVGCIAAPLFSQAKPFHTELWMRRQDGADLWVNLIGYVQNAADLGEGTLWIAEDRSAFKQAETALNRSHEELEQRVQERTAELANLIKALNAAIGERTLMEEALRESEERYRAVYRDNPSMFFTLDVDGTVISVNQFGASQLGYTVDELEGQSVLNVFYEADQTAVVEQLRSCLHDPQRVHHWQFRKVHKDGHLLWVDEFARAVHGSTGSRRVLVVCQDITERKRAEDELQARQHFLALLNDITRAALEMPNLATMLQTLADREGELFHTESATITLWDTATETTLSLPASAPELQDVDCTFRSEPGDLTLTAAVLRAGRALAIDAVPHSPYFDPNLAAQFPIQSVLGLPLIARDQKLGAVLIAFKQPHHFTLDEIARGEQAAGLIALAVAKAKLLNELEQRVTERTAELAAANQELEAFCYSVSHDLRAPLRAIDGFSRILLEEHIAQLDTEAQHYLRRTHETTRRMGELIDDLLVFARLSHQPLNKQPLALADLAHDVLDNLCAEYEQRQVEIRVGELPACQADPALLTQVLINLLSNALKYTRKRDVTRIELRGQLINGEPLYYVKDNGAGFDMRYAHKLFGVFQRLHASTEFEGTGVGLAIVRRIIHRHGGQVWAEGAVGQGATFYFTLPVLYSQPKIHLDSF